MDLQRPCKVRDDGWYLNVNLKVSPQPIFTLLLTHDLLKTAILEQNSDF